MDTVEKGRLILRKESQRDILAYLVIFGCLLYLLNLSWMRWGSLIADMGREMYVPWAIVKGRILYKDIWYPYGPFSPYLHALLYILFKPHVNCLIASGIATTLFSALLIYEISKAFLNRLSSLLAALTFLFVFAFGYTSIFNFILPYSFSSTHATLFSLAALYLFMRFMHGGKKRYLVGSSLLVVVALLCRFEIGFALGGTIFACLVIYYLTGNKRPRISWPIPLILVFIAIFVAMVAAPFLIKTNVWGIWKANFLLPILFNINKFNIFARPLSGHGERIKNLLLLGKSLGIYAAVTASFCLGSRCVSVAFLRRRNFAYPLSVVGVSMLWTTLLFAQRYINYWSQYRCLPLICVLLICGYLFKLCILKKREALGEDVSLLALCLFSLLSLLRIIMEVHPVYYGFYLLVPGMVVYYIFLLDIAPRLLRCKTTFFLGAYMILFVFLINDYLAVSRAAYKGKTLRIETSRGVLYRADDNRERLCRELIDFLLKNTRRDDTVVVLPEGAAINFLSQRENPLFYYQFLPPDFLRRDIEAEMIHQFISKKIGYVVILKRPVFEYGYTYFGVDYGEQLFGYIERNYKIIKVLGPLPFKAYDFSIAVFKNTVTRDKAAD